MSTTNLLNNILIGTGHPDLINSIDFQGLMVHFLPDSWLLPTFGLLNKIWIQNACLDLFLHKYCGFHGLTVHNLDEHSQTTCLIIARSGLTWPNPFKIKICWFPELTVFSLLNSRLFQIQICIEPSLLKLYWFSKTNSGQLT